MTIHVRLTVPPRHQKAAGSPCVDCGQPSVTRWAACSHCGEPGASYLCVGCAQKRANDLLAKRLKPATSGDGHKCAYCKGTRDLHVIDGKMAYCESCGNGGPLEATAREIVGPFLIEGNVDLALA